MCPPKLFKLHFRKEQKWLSVPLFEYKICYSEKSKRSQSLLPGDSTPMSRKPYRLNPKCWAESQHQGGRSNYIAANLADSLAFIWLTSYTNFAEMKRDLNLVVCSCQRLSSIIACLLLPKSKAGLAKVGRGWAEILDAYLYMCLCERVIKY